MFMFQTLEHCSILVPPFIETSYIQKIIPPVWTSWCRQESSELLARQRALRLYSLLPLQCILAGYQHFSQLLCRVSTFAAKLQDPTTCQISASQRVFRFICRTWFWIFCRRNAMFQKFSGRHIQRRMCSPLAIWKCAKRAAMQVSAYFFLKQCYHKIWWSMKVWKSGGYAGRLIIFLIQYVM